MMAAISENIESCLFGLNGVEVVEVVEVFGVVFVGQDAKWGGNAWGKE